jgi:tetratricopeptide (TPR) repeat protein
MLAVILLLAAAAFAPCLKNGFINLDDSSYITENPAIRGFSGANVTSWFTSFHKGNYYPLVFLTYALEYQVHGPYPFVYHSLSLALHLINCGLAFWLLLRLTKKRELSFVAAAIWAVHPLRVESVAWAAEQKDLLYVLFVFLSLGWYSEYKQNRKPGKYLLSLASFLLACFSKGMAVALVPLLFIADYFLEKKADRRSWVEKIPYMVAATVFGLAAMKAQQQSLFIEIGRTFSDNLLVAGYGFLFYVIKFIAPVNLSAFHPYPRPSLPWQFYLASLISLVLIAVVPLWRRRYRVAFQGCLFYVASIILVLQIVPVGGFVTAERYSYLSSLGLAWAAAWFLLKLLDVPALKTVGLAFVFLLLAIGTALSAKRCLAWHDSITIWSDAIGVYPNMNEFAYNQRGSAYDLMGQQQKALEDFSRAVEINPQYCDAYYNRSCVYFELDRFDQAIADCDRAVAVCPQVGSAYLTRGMSYAGKQNLSQALSDVSRAIELSPLDASFYYNRAVVYGQMKDLPRAVVDFDRAIELDPGYADAYFYRGRTYFQMGERQRAQADVEKAERAYARAAAAGGHEADEAVFQRAVCLEGLDRLAEARQLYADYLRGPHPTHAREARFRLDRLAP